MMTKLYIKNMVCDRCRMAVGQTLKTVGLLPVNVDLGEVIVEGDITDEQRTQLRQRLDDLGFELLDDRKRQTIDMIKSALVKLVHYHDNRSAVNISDYLAQMLHQDYSGLSKVFSETEGKTIERYYIELRIERVKELLTYDEMTLTEIAMSMNYSSVAYLSTQFKSVTGMKPSEFKAMKKPIRKQLDSL